MRTLLTVILVFSLGACVTPLPETFEFDTDPQILRGQWLASTDTYDVPPRFPDLFPASIKFDPTYIDEKRYSVIGRWETDDGDAFDLTGDVYGDRVTYLRPQTSPIPPMSGLIAELRREGELIVKLCTVERGTNTAFVGYMSPNGDYSRFEDNSISCDGKDAEGFSLRRPD